MKFVFVILAMCLVGCSQSRNVDVDYTTAVNRLWAVHPLGITVEPLPSGNALSSSERHIIRKWHMDDGRASIDFLMRTYPDMKFAKHVATVNLARLSPTQVSLNVESRANGGWFWENDELAARKWSAIIERIVNGQYRPGEPIVPESK